MIAQYHRWTPTSLETPTKLPPATNHSAKRSSPQSFPLDTMASEYSDDALSPESTDEHLLDVLSIWDEKW